MKSLVKKKSVIAYALTGLLTLSLSLLSLNVNAEKTAFANAEQNYYVMDADQLSFEGKVDLPQKDSMNLFMSGTDNTMIQTSVSKSSPSVKLIASAYGDRIYGGDNDAIKVEVKLLFNRWEGEGMFSQDASFITLNAYNSADTSFENPIATLEEYGVLGNFVRTVQFAPEEICNSRGKLQDIVFRVESDATGWASAFIVDYVKIVFESDGKAYAGECVTGENPENVADENVVWTTAKGYCGSYIDFANFGGIYGYVQNPAVVELKKEYFPNVSTVVESDNTETLLLKNAVFAFNVGNLSVDDYEQFYMDVLLTDKRAKGGHELYLYGSQPEKFVDEKGNPVGYVAKVVVESYEQGFHNKISLEKADVQKLAGADGIVSNIYVLYHGNTLDTAEETVGVRNGSQIWVNKIHFLTKAEVEAPMLSAEYAKYDVSELFPVGESVRLQNKATEKAGDIVSIASLEDKQVEELSFAVDMASGDNLAFLLLATGREKVNAYANGGIMFFLSDGKIEISAHMDGAKTRAIGAIPSGTFAGGKQVTIKCIPYYLNSVKSGYYCAILVGGDLIVEDYFRTEDFMEGNDFLMCYESKTQDFAVTLSSSKTEGITSAATLMNVRIKEETMYYSLDKTNLPLSLAWYDTGFDEVSEITCESEVATVKQDVRRVQFNENGTAVVSFSITNAFGTFTSNELSLNCEQIITMPQAVTPFYENPWFIALYFVPVVALIAVGAVLVIKKVKSDKMGE